MGLWGLRRTNLTRSSADPETLLSEAFWRLEAGEDLPPAEKNRLLALELSQTDARLMG